MLTASGCSSGRLASCIRLQAQFSFVPRLNLQPLNHIDKVERRTIFHEQTHFNRAARQSKLSEWAARANLEPSYNKSSRAWTLITHVFKG